MSMGSAGSVRAAARDASSRKCEEPEGHDAHRAVQPLPLPFPLTEATARQWFDEHIAWALGNMLTPKHLCEHIEQVFVAVHARSPKGTCPTHLMCATVYALMCRFRFCLRVHTTPGQAHTSTRRLHAPYAFSTSAQYTHHRLEVDPRGCVLLPLVCMEDTLTHISRARGSPPATPWVRLHVPPAWHDRVPRFDACKVEVVVLVPHVFDERVHLYSCHTVAATTPFCTSTNDAGDADSCIGIAVDYTPAVASMKHAFSKPSKTPRWFEENGAVFAQLGDAAWIYMDVPLVARAVASAVHADTSRASRVAMCSTRPVACKEEGGRTRTDAVEVHIIDPKTNMPVDWH